MANTSDKAQPLTLKFDGWKKKEVLSAGRCIKLASADPDMDNTIGKPSAVIPRESDLQVSGQVLNVNLEPKTFAVYILKKLS